MNTVTTSTTTTDNTAITLATKQSAVEKAGQVANVYAAGAVFADYLAGKPTNTRRAQLADLDLFAAFLCIVTDNADCPKAADLQSTPASWRGVTHGLVTGFRNWLLQNGYSIASVNRALSSVRIYAELAAKAGVITADALAMIRTVKGLGRKQGIEVDKQRSTTRTGHKKAQNVTLTTDQAKALKLQPDTPQGRRDALLMCLLLDHGLRVSEVGALSLPDFDLAKGTMTFYRPKVDLTQTHKLTKATLKAVKAYIDAGDAPAMGSIIRQSAKGGQLGAAGVSERNLSNRVHELGQRIGVAGLSAHDCRHYWATFWAGKVGEFRLMEAGGWTSTATARRYVELASISNEGMDGDD